MTKSTITRERLEALANAEYCKSNPGAWLLGLKEVNELARMALAAMDSEPVAYIDKQWTLVYYVPPMSMGLKIGDKLYRHAQPAPVVSQPDYKAAIATLEHLGYTWHGGEMWKPPLGPVPDFSLIDRLHAEIDALKEQLGSYPAPIAMPDAIPVSRDIDAGYLSGWNDCRAAMLQDGTLTNEDTKQAWTGIPDIDNAINMLDRIDTLESCDDDRVEAVKTVLRRLAGNSPVIPDSSASMLQRWLAFGRGMQNAGSQLPHNLIAETESMLAAAPQEVIHG